MTTRSSGAIYPGRKGGAGQWSHTDQPLTIIESDFKMATDDLTTGPATEGAVFSSTTLSVARNAYAARVILRTVVLALGAEDDGSMAFKGNTGSSRWHPAVNAACNRLLKVRDELMETSNPPALDWLTPVGLIEALDAALWHGYSCPEETRLTNMEAMSAAEVVIDLLDEFLLECDALAKSASPVH